MTNKNPEILAPVGALDMLYAAVRCGADAVYLGGKLHNARGKTEGFDEESLTAAVSYCHERDVKVYYALNTLLFDDELPLAEKQIEQAHNAGVDAIILQDLAVLDIVRKICPDMPLHASTQMSIHNPGGAKLARDMGFSRVVLAREMSRNEIAEVICEVGIETEVFVHGALCMSVSGQCYLSSVLGGRSGNRGHCAQPCRLPFDSGNNDHALSLKDNSIVSRADEMRDLGITSLKIEGRQKRPEYVAAVVTELRKALEGEAPNEEMLRSVFSRSGFTDGYWMAERGSEMFGHRTKDDALSAKPVLAELRALYKDERQFIPIDISFAATSGQPARLTLSDGVHAVTEIGAVPEPARTVALDREKIARSLTKLGGTPYYLRSLQTELDAGLMLPVSALNELRRTGIDRLGRARVADFHIRSSAQPSYDLNSKCMEISKPETVGDEPNTACIAGYLDMSTEHGDLCGLITDRQPESDLKLGEGSSDLHYLKAPLLRIRLAGISQLTSKILNAAYEISLPASEILRMDSRLYGKDTGIAAAIADGKVFCEMPPLMFGEDRARETENLRKIHRLGINDFITGNLYGIELAKELGVKVHGDYGLNITNLASLREYAKLGLNDATLSLELSAGKISKIAADANIATGFIAYGKLPLMRFRNYPGGVSHGDKRGYGMLIDRLGKRWSVADADGTYTLLNNIPLNVTDRLPSFGINRTAGVKGTAAAGGNRRASYSKISKIILYFTDETPSEIENIITHAKAQTLPRGDRTAGLYFKAVE